MGFASPALTASLGHSHQPLQARSGLKILLFFTLRIPGAEPYVWRSDITHAPTGFLARSKYAAVFSLTDADGMNHLTAKFPLVIAKTWSG